MDDMSVSVLTLLSIIVIAVVAYVTVEKRTDIGARRAMVRERIKGFDETRGAYNLDTLDPRTDGEYPPVRSGGFQ